MKMKSLLQGLNDILFAETRFEDLSLALLRIFFGTSILIHGFYKVTDLSFFSDFIAYMNHPIAALFAPMLAYGQVLVGIFLILGLFTRISAFLTFIATINLLVLY